jgi:hypothetical protein
MQDIISEFISRVNVTKKDIADTVSAGINVASFEIYQRLVGRNEGLQIALQLLDDIMTGDEEDDTEQ